jgi:hypothetical protein
LCEAYSEEFCSENTHHYKPLIQISLTNAQVIWKTALRRVSRLCQRKRASWEAAIGVQIVVKLIENPFCLKHCTPLFDVTVLHEKGEQLAVTQTALADSRMRVLTVEDKLKVRELIDT